MRSIEQMYTEGDFNAIRQLLDKEEAAAEEKAKAARKEKIDAAKANMIAAIQAYGDAIGIEIREKSIDRFVMTLASMEKMLGQKDSLLGADSFKSPEGQSFTRKYNKPIVISTADLFSEDDNILKRFLEREV